jgi:uncharacterized protein
MTTGQPPSSDEQTWRVLAHVSAFIQFLGIPSVVGPLVIWLIKRDDAMVEPHARAALNFQLSILIYFVVGGIVAVIAAITIVGLVVTVLMIVLLVLLVLLELVFALLATLAASRGDLYVYPFSLNLIKS